MGMNKFPYVVMVCMVAGCSGADGVDGRDGMDGVDGRDGIDGMDGADGRDGVDGTDGANGRDGTDGADGESSAKPLPDENGVRVAGTETSDFGSGDEPACLSEPSEIDRESAKELGFDVDEHWQRLESPQPVSLRSCGGDEDDRELELEFEILSLTLHEVSPNPNIIEDGLDCGEDYLSYDTVARVSTADGWVSGAFYLTMTAYESNQINGFSYVDLRNFDGTMTFPLELSRSHFAEMEVNFTLVEDSAPRGFFRPRVTYVDDPDTWQSAPGQLTVFPSSEEGYCDGADEVSDAPPVALSDYSGATPPATFPVTVSASATSGVMDVVVNVNGMPVEERAAVESVSIELGEFVAGTEVQVVTTASDDTTSVYSNVSVNGCTIARGTCDEEACEATATGFVQPLDCRGFAD